MCDAQNFCRNVSAVFGGDTQQPRPVFRGDAIVLAPPINGDWLDLAGDCNLSIGADRLNDLCNAVCHAPIMTKIVIGSRGYYSDC